MNSGLAPVVLFVYNRPEHTKKTVEALQKNFLAKDSELFVFSEGPKNEDAKENVEKVREYIRTIVGFKNVTIIEREKNVGLAKSIISGVTEIINKYGKIIVMEDDLMSSPYFLRYMNEALVFYDEEEKVIGIHGYVYPVKGVLPETFFLKGADCWGWATWKRGWELFEEDGQKLLAELKKRGLQKEFDFQGTYPYTQMLEDQIAGKNSSWAILWYASAFLNNKLTLYPGKSLINNIGLDDQGTHCGASDKFSVHLSKEPIKISRIKIEENQMAKKEIRKFFKELRPRPSLLEIINSRNRREQFKYIAIRFVPPILIDAGGWLRSKTLKPEVPEWEYLPGGWPENIKGQRIRGWDAEGVVHTLTKTYPSFIESITAPKPLGLSNEAVTKDKPDLGFHNTVMTFAYVLSLAAKGKNKINFLDWGGGIGHYYKLAKSLFPDLEIDYTCKDMPKLCTAGKKLIPEARFVSDEEDCLNQKYDLVMASTSLHYSQDWQRVLTQLIQCADPYILITRFPIIETKPSYVMIQRPYKYEYDTEYISWCVNKKEFFDVAQKAGAILERIFFCADADNIIIPNAPEEACYQGFLFKTHEIHEKRR